MEKICFLFVRSMSNKNRRLYEFKDFRLDAETPCLWQGGELVSIPPKALGVLIMLVEKSGAVVSREELLEKIWHETFVEEANINYTISLLRKSLNDKKLVQTVPKRGYRFTAEIKKTEGIFEEKPEAKKDFEEKPEENKSFPFAESKRNRRVILAFVAVLSLIFFAGFGFYFWRGNTLQEISATSRNIKTLAVLPFKNLNKTEEENTVSLGLTDSLISRLGSLKRWTIRPLSAVEKFERSKKDSLEFGKELKCDAVLVGTFQIIENRLRVNARLLDVRDGAQIWTANFDETESDIFLLQDNLATAVAASLLEHLTDADARLLGREYTENAEAYRAYLRGRTIFNRRVEGNFQQILDEYQKAVSLDPTFALAYTGLADLFSRRGNGLNGAESFDSYKIAKIYAQKALELDNDLAEAHTSLGRIKRSADWDWTGAEKEFKKAVELDPNNTTALAWYAQLLSSLGRHDEALTMIKRAVEIDPITPSVTGVLFPVLEGRGDFDEGLRLAGEAYLFDKQNSNSRRSYATFLYHKRDYEKAIEIAEESAAKSDKVNHVWWSLLAASYHKSGNDKKAAEFLNKLKEESENNSKFLYSLAVNYAELNRFDEAIAALEKCYELREERLIWMNTEPRFGDLKLDARFQDLVRKMKLDKI